MYQTVRLVICSTSECLVTRRQVRIARHRCLDMMTLALAAVAVAVVVVVGLMRRMRGMTSVTLRRGGRAVTGAVVVWRAGAR